MHKPRSFNLNLAPPPAYLPGWAKDLLESCPSAGAGVHTWLFRTALKLRRVVPNKEQLALLLGSAVANCGRVVTSREIEDAIHNSAQAQFNRGKFGDVHGPRAISAWPSYSKAQAESSYCRVCQEECPPETQFDVDVLRARSAVTEPGHLTPGEVLRALHQGRDELLCAGIKNNHFHTRPLSKWAASFDLHEQQFVVPNAMRSKNGTAKNGKTSARCRDNAAIHRRFIVVEFDQPGDGHMQPALLWHLKTLAPLVMCVHSGGKSLHGWFFVEPKDEVWHRKFFRYAVSIGADHRMWLPEQLARMPNGKRRDQSGVVVAPQPVVYFDPTGVEVTP